MNNHHNSPYKEFAIRFQLLLCKYPHLITTTLSNVFTMRLIGNKTHGDLEEIAIAEFINQYMYDYRSVHVGKDLFRAKEHEEDIQIINEITKDTFPVSLKAYGDGPLQLSTDKKFQMFPTLEKMGAVIEGEESIAKLWADPVFSDFNALNVLPLIYDERKKRCNVLVFDHTLAMQSVARVVYESEGKGRKHPVYRFYDAAGDYVCEVRYGSGTANALQRGLWTHTKNGLKYFFSLTNGWITYEHNPILVKLFSHALLSTTAGHEAALEKLKSDIDAQKNNASLRPF